MKKVILASGSPRRRELLENANIEFEVVVSNVEESIELGATPAEIVESLALQKAEEVADRLANDNLIVLGADTIVVLEQQILGKPQDAADARMMLQLLSGKEHTVYTGVAIISGARKFTFHEKTTVEFWDLTDQEIEAYLASGEPFDKAGSYGIQKLGSTLVKRINGDYFSVVGLPIARTVRELKSFIE